MNSHLVIYSTEILVGLGNVLSHAPIRYLLGCLKLSPVFLMNSRNFIRLLSPSLRCQIARYSDLSRPCPSGAPLGRCLDSSRFRAVPESATARGAQPFRSGSRSYFTKDRPVLHAGRFGPASQDCVPFVTPCPCEPLPCPTRRVFRSSGPLSVLHRSYRRL